MQSLRSRYGALTPREREVMALVCAGLLNKQVGGELGISEITVKAHRGQMMRKMKADSLPELVTPEVGALCDTVDEMVADVATIHTRSAEACRAHAVKYFSHLAMAEGYLRMYRTLLATGKLPPGIPTPYAPPPTAMLR